MIAPTPPNNEAERLAEVRALRILDTPPEERFDRVVKLALQVFGVSIAYIAMVDQDRQWFKSQSGMCDSVKQTSRDVSFCGHTILQDEPMVIPDATEDERFSNNPMVIGEPFIKFYAGHPLKGPGGHNVATLCIADQVARPGGLTGEEAELLRLLADQAEHELNTADVIHSQRELLATKSALIETQQQLQRELDEAADYVSALLPRPVNLDGFKADHRYISSSKLGGDLLGYHALDDEHYAIYLLDVTGHGVGAALLATTIGRALLRHGSLAANLHDPGDVLNALNRSFRFKDNNNKFFTLWYGVLHRPSNTLRYAVGGHHPALLIPMGGEPVEIGSPDLIVGIEKSHTYETRSATLPPGSRLYLFSDGAYEVRNPDGEMLRIKGLQRTIKQHAQTDNGRLDLILDEVRAYLGDDHFPDDVSILELTIGN